MGANWVTLDKFEEMTGINRNAVLSYCRRGEWPEFIAWDKFSPKIYLINIAWWDKWRDTLAASNRKRMARGEAVSNRRLLDDSTGSPSPLIPPDLDK